MAQWSTTYLQRSQMGLFLLSPLLSSWVQGLQGWQGGCRASRSRWKGLLRLSPSFEECVHLPPSVRLQNSVGFCLLILGKFLAIALEEGPALAGRAKGLHFTCEGWFVYNWVLPASAAQVLGGDRDGNVGTCCCSSFLLDCKVKPLTPWLEMISWCNANLK